MRVVFSLFCLIIGGFGSYYAQPYVHKNADLILIIVTVFTVFAGFLIAIITIIGDPVMIPDGSWRIAETGRDRMETRLFWHTVLLICYLITIGLLFTGVILESALDQQSMWRIWIERSYLFFGISSFLFTFALPGALMKLQHIRYDAETARRRATVGIKDEDGPGVS